jgi:hypothetical protein
MSNRDRRKQENPFFGINRRVETITEEKRRASTSIITSMALVTVLASLPLVQFTFINAYAMGDNPSTCKKLYDSRIVFMQIKEGNNYYYPQWEQAQFTSKVGQGYDVMMIIHASSINKDGNSDIGSIWYSDNSLGFGNGHCISNVRHDSFITITVHHIVMGQAHHGLKQNVYWDTWARDSVEQGPTYDVTWN